jgi:small subunit ribosomal protein S20
LANTASAEKRNRQAQKRRVRNVQVRTGVKSAVKKVREAIEKGDAAAAKTALAAAERTLGKASSKGVVHANAASRRISRLAKAVAHVGAGGAAAAKA